MLNLGHRSRTGPQLMQFGRALFYSFDDQRWLNKLARTVLLTVLCGIPLMGLIPLCGLLGYLTEIVRNVSQSHPRPLPNWERFGKKVKQGLSVLLAVLVYNLPPVILAGLLYVFNPMIAVSLFGGITFVGIVAGLLPLLLIYTAVAWSMLAVGLMRYAETGDKGEFYRFSKLFRRLQTDIALTLQWLLYCAAANIALFILMPFALLGLALYFPVHGYLIGNYSRMLQASEQAHRQGSR